MNPIAVALLMAMLALYSVAALKLLAWWFDRRDSRRVQDFKANQMEAEGHALIGKRRAQEQKWRDAA